MIGRRIGSWILERELGRGGMGAVFEARHATLQTRAAVKVLSPGLESEETFRLRFRREAELQSQLRHPNIARVLDYLEDQGQWFLVVEYLDRGSLAGYLAHGERVSHGQAVAWARQALAGLGHAHGKGIVHRDVKPANLLLTDNGEIVVADFGIARSQGAAGLTTTGVAAGTPHYMSPEQIVTPERVDHRADIYSLGVVLYELLAGRKPFDAPSQFTILQAHVSQAPPPLRTIDPTIVPQLEAAVMRALAKNAGDRYQDCDSMIAALDDRAAPAAVGGGATIRASKLLMRAPAASLGAPSANTVSHRKRRSYRNRVAAAVLTLVAVATLFASIAANQIGKNDVTPEKKDTAATTSITTTGPPPQPRAKPPYRSIVVRPPSTDVDPPPNAKPSLPSIPQLPEHPRVAVIGTGDDPLLAGALEQEMERRLDGLDVADEQGDPGVAELLRKKGANVGFDELGAALAKAGFQILVLLRVQTAASRTTSFRGIDGSIKAARMHLNAYMLRTHRPIGSGWTEPAEYTETSGAATARNAFIGATADLRTAIDADWERLRSGAAP